MKTRLIILTAMVGAAACRGQGTVVFNNSTGLVQRWTSAWITIPTPIPAGTESEMILLKHFLLKRHNIAYGERYLWE